MARPGEIRVGTSGWVYPHWRGLFYPQKLPVKNWFKFYSQEFDTAEINNTFYRLPQPETFDAWREEAPPGFIYAVKASRFLTHFRKLKEPAEPLENILSRTVRLRPHLGPVLYQLPPRWKRNVERLQEFATALPAGIEHVIEFRDSSWIHPEIEAVLHKTKLSYCLHDMGGFECPAWVTGRVVYIRFHGAGAKYGGNYPMAHLKKWAQRVAEYASAGRAVYVYFNNDIGGHAITNARQLKELLA